MSSQMTGFAFATGLTATGLQFGQQQPSVVDSCFDRCLPRRTPNSAIRPSPEHRDHVSPKYVPQRPACLLPHLRGNPTTALSPCLRDTCAARRRSHHHPPPVASPPPTAAAPPRHAFPAPPSPAPRRTPVAFVPTPDGIPSDPRPIVPTPDGIPSDPGRLRTDPRRPRPYSGPIPAGLPWTRTHPGPLPTSL
jgi:hypothetical protein